MQKNINTTNIGERNYGIDFLRILAMFMIVVLHVLGRGGVLNATSKLSDNYEVAWLMETLCYCAVNCYALISGYVGLRGHFRYSSLINLWFRVLFYTICITIVFDIFLPDSVGIKEIINALFPTMRSQYWYWTAYVIAYLCIPFLNRAIETFDRRTMQNFLLVLVVFLSALPLFFKADVFKLSGGYSAVWLIVMYVIGAAIRKCGFFERKKSTEAFGGFLAMIFLSWTMKLVIDISGVAFLSRFNLIGYTSPTMILAAAYLFVACKNLHISNIAKKIIMLLSPLSFSVYLIHVHPLVFNILIKDSFMWLAEQPWFILVGGVIISALLIFATCCLIDAIREFVFKKINIKTFAIWIGDRIDTLLNRICLLLGD